jgi:hypothetical protein
MGFNSICIHKFKTSHNWYGGVKYFKAPIKSCPDCNKKGQYDGNKIRMVLDYGDDPVQFGGPDGGEYAGYGIGGPVMVCSVM